MSGFQSLLGGSVSQWRHLFQIPRRTGIHLPLPFGLSRYFPEGSPHLQDQLINWMPFAGPECGEAIDYCVLEPCRNGGQCSSKDGSYHCQCPGGFQGPRSIPRPSNPCATDFLSSFQGWIANRMWTSAFRARATIPEHASTWKDPSCASVLPDSRDPSAKRRPTTAFHRRAVTRPSAKIYPDRATIPATAGQDSLENSAKST